jgi:hypothetical protein
VRACASKTQEGVCAWGAGTPGTLRCHLAWCCTEARPPALGRRDGDEPLWAGPATYVQRGHGSPGVEVPAHPPARGSQCPVRGGPVLALHLPGLQAAEREGDRAGGVATGHRVEEEPDGLHTLQVLLRPPSTYPPHQPGSPL